MPDSDEADSSRTTAEFRAFVSQFGGPENTQPWTMRVTHNRAAVLFVAGAAIVILVIVLLAVR